MSARTEASSVSHMSNRRTPGTATVLMYLRTARCTSAAWRTSLYMSASRRSRSRHSAEVVRHALLQSERSKRTQKAHIASAHACSAQKVACAHAETQISST
jgi:hypothetical protein